MLETIKFPNGMSITGTHENIVDAARRLGYGNMFNSEYYYSESKGVYTLISEMNTTHLRNAILKVYREWVAELSTIKNPQALVEKIRTGITSEVWINMVREYYTRKEE